MSGPARLDRGRMDRALGAVLASACGDALGAGYEFADSKLPEDPADVAMIGGGLGPWEPGEWTDDTQMALSILDVLACRRGDATVDLVAIGENFLQWAATHPPDIGNQTREVLCSEAEAEDLLDWSEKVQEIKGDIVGNGGLMRSAPVALVALDDRHTVARLAADASRLTHAHADSQEACVLWCEAIRLAACGAEPTMVGEWTDLVTCGLDLVAAERRDLWRERIDEAVSRPPSTFHPNGWVVSAFQAALAAVAQTPVRDGAPAAHLKAALQAAVMIGNDTDTVAAIAGALLGARWGASALPEEWIDLLHGIRRKGEPVVRADDLEALVRVSLVA